MALKTITVGDRDWDSTINTNFTDLDTALSAVAADKVIARKEGMRLRFDATNIYIDPGGLEITYNVGGDTGYYYVNSTITKTPTLAATQTYYVYAAKPSSGTALSATDISTSYTNTPTYSAAKGDYYYNYTRMIGKFTTDGSAEIVKVFFDARFNVSSDIADGEMLQYKTDDADGYIQGVTTISLASGGTGAALSDPAAHKLLGWDDTDQTSLFITLGSGLTYTQATHTLSISSSVTVATITSSVTDGIPYIGKSVRCNSTDEIVFQLPSASNGNRIQFVKINTGKVTIVANAGKKIGWESTTGGNVSNTGSEYATITLEYVSTISAWIVINASGTWDYA